MKNKFNPLDFWAKSDTGYYFHICEGTGDNLLKEDIKAGYVDYIYYDYYETIQDIYEDRSYDGGQILLKKLYQDMSTQDILAEVEEFEDVKLEIVY